MNKTISFLGVDPGVNGGLAVVAVADGAASVLVECIDIPVVGTGAKERVDVAAIRNSIDRHKPGYALVERAGATPGRGVASSFKYGQLARSRRLSRCARSRWRSSSRQPGSGSGNSPARIRKRHGKRPCNCFLTPTRHLRASVITAALNPR